MKPVKHSVAVAVFHPDGRVLAVQRPADDEDLPNAWGLPAASLRSQEDWERAAMRAGRDKLGVTFELLGELTRGESERADYRLQMRLYEARVVNGAPHVPQPSAGVTQYRDWCWADPELLRPAADSGSLCCQLFLQTKTDS